VSDAHLSGSVSTGGGKVLLSNVSGGLRGTSGSGPVVYRDGNDDGRADSKKGRMHISRAGGDISVNEITDGADLKTGGGDIGIRRANGDVAASTGGGNISIGHLSGGVRADTGAGTIRIDVDELAADGRGITVGTGHGDVVIELPAGVAATFELETAYTDNYRGKTRIDNDWSLPV